MLLLDSAFKVGHGVKATFVCPIDGVEPARDLQHGGAIYQIAA